MSIERERKKITEQIRKLEDSLNEIDKGVYEMYPGGDMRFREGHKPTLINAHMMPVTRMTITQKSIEFWDGISLFTLEIKENDEMVTPLTIEFVGGG